MDQAYRFDVSLIIPCYLGQDWIEPCLQSIAGQTLARNRFEVLAIVNGPVDDSPQIIDQVLGADPDLNYRIIYSEMASLSNARNLGIANARGRSVTWVDVDDWLSPNYLEELERAAAEGTLPVAQVVDVLEGTEETAVSPITEQILSFPPGRVDPVELWRPLGFAACKLLPTDLARKDLFDVTLRSGEDVAYFAPFVAKNRLVFNTAPAHAGATYYRMVRASSLSRQEPNFDFSVSQRLEVMKHLDRAVKETPGPLANVMRSMMNSQALFMARYLDERPDEFSRVRDALVSANLAHTPWYHVTSRTPNLAISYNFPPFADASSLVAAKRIYNSGEHWNVISNDMSGVRAVDPGLNEITGPAVSRHKTVHARTSFGSWLAIEEFCDQGLIAIEELEAVSGPQNRVYSRSMWPASHFLAALHKLKAPYDVSWTAEFSDPLSRDAGGQERASDDRGEEFRRQFRDLLSRLSLPVPDSTSLFVWAEILPYLMADKVLFTNVHQMNYMLSYVPDEELARRVRSKSHVSAQPVLPRRFYDIRTPSHELKPDVANVGYFGTFYPNRGAGVLLDALEVLPADVRADVRVHIYAPNDQAVQGRIADSNIKDAVVWREQVDYLDFLALSTRFDALVVADAETMSTNRRLNPYRPSKLSDYLGAGVPIWAIYEPGSVLSRADVKYRTRIGDVHGMAMILQQIHAEKVLCALR